MGAYVIEPRRLVRGIATSPAVAAQNSFIALYNDSSSAYYISLIHASLQGATVIQPGSYGGQGLIGTLADRGQSVIAGRGAQGGAMYVGATATPATAQQQGSLTGPASNTVIFYPIVVLSPGWYWLYFHTTVNTALALNMLWSVDDTDDIDPFVDSTVFKAAQARA